MKNKSSAIVKADYCSHGYLHITFNAKEMITSVNLRQTYIELHSIVKKLEQVLEERETKRKLSVIQGDKK